MASASDSQSVRETLRAMAMAAGREVTPFVIAMMLSDLDGYDEVDVLAALSRYRKERAGFPMTADIISRIDDGRPGPEEAWAMIPKSEADSVVWTDEMCAAYGVARSLLESDEIGARMAFRETYTKLVADARADRTPARWSPSLGLNKAGHIPVLLDAVRRGRLSEDHARKLMPEIATPKASLQIAGPAEPELSAVDPAPIIATILQQIEKSGNA